MVQARPRRVAVVDDDEAVRDSLLLLLAGERYAVEIYPTAEAFLAGAPWDTIDCLVLDTNLRTLDGFQLVERLHAQGFTAPILVVTARLDRGTARRARSIGVAEVIEKPYEAVSLLAAIRLALSGRGP
jgi:FixJ family two-component response regulator